MSGDDQVTPPLVLWAQRSKYILLTICLEDCLKPEIKISNDKIYFKGTGGTDKKTHEVTINFFKEVIPEESSHFIRARNIECSIKKKEEGPFWPHLTKEKIKYHFLKVDFNKWRDEDAAGDDEEEKDIGDINNMLQEMAGMGDAAFEPKLKMDDLNNDTDSDDADLPDLE